MPAASPAVGRLLGHGAPSAAAHAQGGHSVRESARPVDSRGDMGGAAVPARPEGGVAPALHRAGGGGTRGAGPAAEGVAGSSPGIGVGCVVSFIPPQQVTSPVSVRAQV